MKNQSLFDSTNNNDINVRRNEDSEKKSETQMGFEPGFEPEIVSNLPCKRTLKLTPDLIRLLDSWNGI